MTAIANTDTALPHRWLRVVLVLIAARYAVRRAKYFYDYQHPTAFLRFAQTLTSIKLALVPVIAGAALIYAALNLATADSRHAGSEQIGI